MSRRRMSAVTILQPPNNRRSSRAESSISSPKGVGESGAGSGGGERKSILSGSISSSLRRGSASTTPAPTNNVPAAAAPGETKNSISSPRIQEEQKITPGQLKPKLRQLELDDERNESIMGVGWSGARDGEEDEEDEALQDFKNRYLQHYSECEPERKKHILQELDAYSAYVSCCLDRNRNRRGSATSDGVQGGGGLLGGSNTTLAAAPSPSASPSPSRGGRAPQNRVIVTINSVKQMCDEFDLNLPGLDRLERRINDRLLEQHRLQAEKTATALFEVHTAAALTPSSKARHALAISGDSSSPSGTPPPQDKAAPADIELSFEEFEDLFRGVGGGGGGGHGSPGRSHSPAPGGRAMYDPTADADPTPRGVSENPNRATSHSAQSGIATVDLLHADNNEMAKATGPGSPPPSLTNPRGTLFVTNNANNSNGNNGVTYQSGEAGFHDGYEFLELLSRVPPVEGPKESLLLHCPGEEHLLQQASAMSTYFGEDSRLESHDAHHHQQQQDFSDIQLGQSRRRDGGLTGSLHTPGAHMSATVAPGGGDQSQGGGGVRFNFNANTVTEVTPASPKHAQQTHVFGLGGKKRAEPLPHYAQPKKQHKDQSRLHPSEVGKNFVSEFNKKQQFVELEEARRQGAANRGLSRSQKNNFSLPPTKQSRRSSAVRQRLRELDTSYDTPLLRRNNSLSSGASSFVAGGGGLAGGFHPSFVRGGGGPLGVSARSGAGGGPHGQGVNLIDSFKADPFQLGCDEVESSTSSNAVLPTGRPPGGGGGGGKRASNAGGVSPGQQSSGLIKKTGSMYHTTSFVAGAGARRALDVGLGSNSSRGGRGGQLQPQPQEDAVFGRLTQDHEADPSVTVLHLRQYLKELEKNC